MRHTPPDNYASWNLDGMVDYLNLLDYAYISAYEVNEYREHNALRHWTGLQWCLEKSVVGGAGL